MAFIFEWNSTHRTSSPRSTRLAPAFFLTTRLRSFDDLDAKSKLRFGAHLGRFLRFADSLYLNFLDGTLDKRLWRGYERTIADTVAYPGFQTWWATRKHWHTDEFCALIDRHIQTAKPKIYDGYN